MRLPLIAALTAVMLLQACGGFRESRINPLNWFGRSAPVPVIAVADAPADARAQVQEVVSMAVDPYPGGAIVRATGLPPTQGYWEAELVARPVDENGVLVYDFLVFPPLTTKNAGPQQSREIAVGANLSTRELAGISQIVVQGLTNARASRR